MVISGQSLSLEKATQASMVVSISRFIVSLTNTFSLAVVPCIWDKASRPQASIYNDLSRGLTGYLVCATLLPPGITTKYSFFDLTPSS